LRKSLPKTVPLLAIAGLLLTGCSAPTDFKTTGELISAWEEFTETDCVNPAGGSPIGDEGIATCSEDSGMQVFPSPDRLQEVLQEGEKSAMSVGYEATAVIGEDWLVMDRTLDHEGFAKKHGGEVLTIGAGK
jgi:hypothetical protein